MRNIKSRLMRMAFVFALSACNMASAQVVQVEGYGIDRNSAIRDAGRNAVEQVVGTYVDSRTLVNNGLTELDNIYTNAQGYINNVQVLSESPGSNYKVIASVDVNTLPDAALMSKLNMIASLNDPRIDVVITNNGQQDMITETALNSRLLEMGFTHVVDTSLSYASRDIQLINGIYNGTDMSSIALANGADYLILGKASSSSNAISLPDGRGGYKESLMKTSRTTLSIKIVRFATGDILGTFTVEGQGVDNSEEFATNKALKDAAGKAAAEVEKKFKKIAAANLGSMKILAFTQDYSKVEALAADLRNVSGVSAVRIREFSNGRAIIELDSVQKPHFVAQMLKRNSHLSLFVDGISDSNIRFIVR